MMLPTNSTSMPLSYGLNLPKQQRPPHLPGGFQSPSPSSDPDQVQLGHNAPPPSIPHSFPAEVLRTHIVEVPKHTPNELPRFNSPDVAITVPKEIPAMAPLEIPAITPPKTKAYPWSEVPNEFPMDVPNSQFLEVPSFPGGSIVHVLTPQEFTIDHPIEAPPLSSQEFPSPFHQGLTLSSAPTILGMQS